MLGTIRIVGVLTQSKEPQHLGRWKSLKAQECMQLSTSLSIIITSVIFIKKPSIK